MIITHVYFITLTFADSLGRDLNTSGQLYVQTAFTEQGKCFKYMYMKNMYDHYDTVQFLYKAMFGVLRN